MDWAQEIYSIKALLKFKDPQLVKLAISQAPTTKSKMSTRLTSSKLTVPTSTPSRTANSRSPSHIQLTRPELNASCKSPSSSQKHCSLRATTSVCLELTTQMEILILKLGSMTYQTKPDLSLLAPSKWLVAIQMAEKLKMASSTSLLISKSTESIDHGTTTV